MKLWFRHLKWRLFGYPDFPPRDFNVIPSTNRYSGTIYMPRYKVVAFNYLEGRSIQELADIYGVTRERIRQMLWKAYRNDTERL